MEYDEEEILEVSVPFVEIDYSQVKVEDSYLAYRREKDFFKNRNKLIESKIEEKKIYTMVDCLSAFELNDKREIVTEATELEGKLDTILCEDNWQAASDVFDVIREEWVHNGARGALTAWPDDYSEIGYGTEVDYGKMHVLTLYNLTRIETKNKYLYEMYAYLLYLEALVGRKLIWSRHWRAFKYMLAFDSFDVVHHYQLILRMCEDRYFQQYMNLVSLVYNWGLIFSYPYVEILRENRSSREVKAKMVAMTPVLDEEGEGVNRGGVTRIGIKRLNDVTYVDFDICKCMPYLSAKDYISLSLVSKSFLSAVARYIRPFRDYTNYLGKYAYGVGLERVASIRRIHTYNGPYSGSFFGSQIYHESKNFCQQCLDSDDVTGDMNEFGNEAQVDRYVLGYAVELFVDWTTVEWVVTVMEKLPLEYRKVYDKMFCLTTGHFANIYDSCVNTSDKFENEMIKYYKKDSLFHMLMPFVPGALNWSWDNGYRIGQQYALLNSPS